MESKQPLIRLSSEENKEVKKPIPSYEQLTKAHEEQVKAIQQLLNNLSEQHKRQKEELTKQQEVLAVQKQKYDELAVRVSSLESTTARQSEDLTKQDKKIKKVDKDTTKIKYDLTGLSKNVENLTDNVEAIEKRVKRLEQKMAEVEKFIKQTKEANEAQKKAVAYFSKYEKLMYFYVNFWAKLDERMGAAKAIRSGKVGIASTKKEDAIQVISSVLQTGASLVPEAGDLVAGLIDLGEIIFKLVYGNKRTQRLSTLGGIHPGSVSIYAIAELLAREIALAYSEGLVCLSQKGIDHLVDGLIHRLKSYVEMAIKSSKPWADSSNAYLIDIVAITHKLEEAIIHSNEKGGEPLEVYLPPDFELTKHKKEKWTIDTFLQKPGYKTRCSGDASVSHFYNITSQEPNRYLYRGITKEQLKELDKNYKQHKSKDRPKENRDPLTIIDSKQQSLAGFNFKK